MREQVNKLSVFLMCLCVALLITFGVTHARLQEAKATVAKQEAQLKELYAQVNELTVQYVGIVKRIQQHDIR